MNSSDTLRALVVYFLVLPFLAVLVVLMSYGGILEERPVLQALAVLVLCGGGVVLMAIANEPFRRAHLREEFGKEVQVDWKEEFKLFVGGLLVTPVLLHYVLEEPWSHSWSRSAAILAYFVVFVPLGRLQRRGFAPYWRPAWYGFVLAGIAGGLTWDLLTGDVVDMGLSMGVPGSLMHYGYCRWSTRGARRLAE